MHPHQHDVVGRIAKNLHMQGADQAEWKKTLHTHEGNAEPNRQREHSGAQEREGVEDEPVEQDGAILPEQREIERPASDYLTSAANYCQWRLRLTVPRD